jgi:hypothetical protein
VEDMRAVRVDVDTIFVFRIAVAADVIAFVYNQHFISGIG